MHWGVGRLTYKNDGGGFEWGGWWWAVDSYAPPSGRPRTAPTGPRNRNGEQMQLQRAAGIGVAWRLRLFCFSVCRRQQFCEEPRGDLIPTAWEGRR